MCYNLLSKLDRLTCKNVLEKVDLAEQLTSSYFGVSTGLINQG
jgi:hypothetical protein